MQDIIDCVALLQVHLRLANLKLEDKKIQDYFCKIAKMYPDLTVKYPLPWNHFHKLPDVVLITLCNRLLEVNKDKYNNKQ